MIVIGFIDLIGSLIVLIRLRCVPDRSSLEKGNVGPIQQKPVQFDIPRDER